jgi:shikimate kinase
MPLIYITGPTGSGKSTICKELRKLGYDTYDTDEKGNRFWINKKTSQPVEPYKIYRHGSNWHSEHRVGLSPDWIKQLKSTATEENKVIFICGINDNDLEFVDSYDKIILLNIDETTQKSRIIGRSNSRYCKEPKQLAAAIKCRQAQIDKYRRAGASEIDGKIGSKEIVEKILSVTREP